MEDYLFPIIMFAIAVACWVLMFRVSARGKRGVKNAFTYLALTHNLTLTDTYNRANPLPTATGTYQERTLTVASKLVQEMMPQKAYTLVTVTVANSLTTSLRITPATLGAGAFTKERIRSDDAFDKRYVVEGSHEIFQRAFPPMVLQEILRLTQLGFIGTYEVRGSEITFHTFGLMHNDKELRKFMDVIAVLYTIAHNLEV